MSIILPIATVILFFVTQDLTAKMGMVDSWTIVMVTLAIIEIGLTALKKVKK